VGDVVSGLKIEKTVLGDVDFATVLIMQQHKNRLKYRLFCGVDKFC
jgi:hypothetical protein